MIVNENINVRVMQFDPMTMIEYAWTVSRPNETEPSAEAIMRMDVPVNEMIHIFLHVRAPIVVREIICSQRNHIVWARSSRVDDLSTWQIWATGCSAVELEEIKDLHDEMHRKMHLRQDDFRLLLPLAYMTEFCCKVSLREFVRWASCMSDYGLAWESFLVRAMDALKQSNPDLHEEIYDLARQKAYATGDLLPAPRQWADGLLGDYVLTTQNVSVALRAQLVRHRAVQVKDMFRDFVNSMSAKLNSALTCQTLMPVDFAEKLLAKRSCWIAQTDLWEPVLARLRAVLKFDENPHLPCDDGQCRFTRDNDLRKAGRDPAPPCPVAARLVGEKLVPHHATAAAAYAAQRPAQAFWQREIENVTPQI